MRYRMRCIKRYGITLILVFIVVLIVHWHSPSSLRQNGRSASGGVRSRRSFDHFEPVLSFEDESRSVTPPLIAPKADDVADVRHCRMDNCFDLDKCKRHGFSVYVYPHQEEFGPISKNYQKILDSIRRSPHFTNDPDKACIKVLAIDSVDRDPLSKERFVSNFAGRLQSVSTWNRGRNHLVFNLYSGTWPEYLEELGFDLGHALLAKASISTQKYRNGFDISLPLWGENHPVRGRHSAEMKVARWSPLGQHLMSFKGKRYLNGIGSETRNSLFHLHDGTKSVMLTTCRHGKDWEKLCPDEKCLEKCLIDNAEYEKWDYVKLLQNSTFCLVPRGRRLGSFRFIETLQQACVPVVLANDWVLPFSEVIDWNRAVISWDEKLLIELGHHLADVSPDSILRMRQQGALLYNMYFSSVDQIIRTTLEIIRERIFPHESRGAFVWNSTPGALSMVPNVFPRETPFFHESRAIAPTRQFTALIHAVQTVPSSASPIVKLIKSLWKSDYCGQIIVLWACEHSPPASSRWPEPPEGREFLLLKDEKLLMTSRMYPHDKIKFNSVLSLDNDVTLNQEEINFAFSVWQSFPHRIVGFPSRRHYLRPKSSTLKWAYTSKWGNEYSIVLTGAAFVHRYYLRLFQQIPASALDRVNQYANCEDILMNFLVSDVTGLPPIKVTQKKQYMTRVDGTDVQPVLGKLASRWDNSSHFQERQRCMNAFVDDFGTMPLQTSELRLDPLLFKDDVARFRKRYPNIDSVEP